MRRPFLTATAALSILLLALSAVPRPVDAETGTAVMMVLGERPVAGKVTGVSATEIAIVATGAAEARKVPLDQVVEVSFPISDEAAIAPSPYRATLMGGEVLLGTIAKPDDEGFSFAIAGVGSVRLAYEALRSLEALPETPDPCNDLASKHGPVAEGDVIHMRKSGDRHVGALAAADAESVSIEDSRERIRKIAWRDVLVMHLANDPIDPPKGVHCEVELVGGSRIATAKPAVLGAGGLQVALRSQPDATLTIPMRRVRALRYAGGKFVFASQLPFEETYTNAYLSGPLLAAHMKKLSGARANLRPDGCPLRIAGKTYRHGFGVHSKSELRIQTKGAYSAFQAVVGIDDIVFERGKGDPKVANVDVRVLGDGKVLWEAKGLTPKNGPRKLGPLALDGVQELTLVVDFGKHTNLSDRVDWVNPILVK